MCVLTLTATVDIYQDDNCTFLAKLLYPVLSAAIKSCKEYDAGSVVQLSPALQSIVQDICDATMLAPQVSALLM